MLILEIKVLIQDMELLYMISVETIMILQLMVPWITIQQMVLHLSRDRHQNILNNQIFLIQRARPQYVDFGSSGKEKLDNISTIVVCREVQGRLVVCVKRVDVRACF